MIKVCPHCKTKNRLPIEWPLNEVGRPVCARCANRLFPKKANRYAGKKNISKNIPESEITSKNVSAVFKVEQDETDRSFAECLLFFVIVIFVSSIFSFWDFFKLGGWSSAIAFFLMLSGINLIDNFEDDIYERFGERMYEWIIYLLLVLTAYTFLTGITFIGTDTWPNNQSAPGDTPSYYRKGVWLLIIILSYWPMLFIVSSCIWAFIFLDKLKTTSLLRPQTAQKNVTAPSEHNHKQNVSKPATSNSEKSKNLPNKKIKTLLSEADINEEISSHEALPPNLLNTSGYGPLSFQCGCGEFHEVNSENIEIVATYRPVKFLFKCKTHYTKVSIEGLFSQNCVSECTFTIKLMKEIIKKLNM